MANLGARLSQETTNRRNAAFEEGSDALDRLLGSDQELAEYEKLKDEPNKLAEKIAKLVFGSVLDVGLDSNNERLKTVFELNFLENDEDKRQVLDKAFQDIKVLDGGGVAGNENMVVGATSLLDPESRARLSSATKTMLNMLEHGQWTTQVSLSDARTEFEAGGTPSQALAGHSGGAAELPVISISASTENRDPSIQIPPGDNKRAATPTPLDGDESRAAPRRRQSPE